MSDRQQKLAAAQGAAIRKVAALLETIASLIENGSGDDCVPTLLAPPLVPTRKMPAMEETARALDEAVRDRSGADSRQPAGQREIPLPEVTTVKLKRPEQMLELLARSDPPGTIVEVEPVGAPHTRRMGSRNGSPPGAPTSFGRSHPK